MPRPPSFRIHDRNISLTYPQCPIPKSEALDLLKALFTDRPPNYIRVAQELHDDGQPRIHALLQFPYMFQTENQRFFDLVSSTRSTHFHPNIEGAHNPYNPSPVQYKIFKYVDFCDFGEFRTAGKKYVGDVYRAALDSSNKADSLQIIRYGDPKTFKRRYKRLSKTADLIFKPPPEVFTPLYTQFNVPVDIQEWARKNIRPIESRPHGPISLILEGPSGIGKTCWARSLGRHNYYAGQIDLRNYDDDALFNVIDNVKPACLKQWMVLIGAQQCWTANVKYGKPKIIQGGIPSIVLCNPCKGSSYKAFLEKAGKQGLKDWTLAHAQFKFLENPLWL